MSKKPRSNVTHLLCATKLARRRMLVTVKGTTRLRCQKRSDCLSGVSSSPSLSGAFSFSLVAQGRCVALDLGFLSDKDSRFFFGTGVSSSPSLSVQPSPRPKGNRFRRSLSLSLGFSSSENMARQRPYCTELTRTIVIRRLTSLGRRSNTFPRQLAPKTELKSRGFRL